MRKRTRKKTESKQKSEDRQKSVPSPPLPAEPDDEHEKGGSYGGLPKMDLKKNLGCG